VVFIACAAVFITACEWGDSRLSFTVSFHANGGRGEAPNSQTVNVGSYVTLPDRGKLSRIGFTFTGWNTRADGSGRDFPIDARYTPTGNITLYAKWNPTGILEGYPLVYKLNWLRTYAQIDGTYIIEISCDCCYESGITPTEAALPDGRGNITIILRGSGGMRTVNLSASGILFTIGPGVVLVLDENITLRGTANNSGPLVQVDAYGSLIMNAGTAITGNHGGGVNVHGTFAMHGGTISHNIGNNNGGTGGVSVEGGTFVMYDGRIYRNTGGPGTNGNDGSDGSVGRNPYNNGGRGHDGGIAGTGGVSVNSGTFRMYDGIIDSNIGGRGGNGGHAGNAGRGNHASGTVRAGDRGGDGGEGGFGGDGGTGGVSIIRPNSAFFMHGGTISVNNGGVGGNGGNGGRGGNGGNGNFGFNGRSGGNGGAGGNGGNGGTGGVSIYSACTFFMYGGMVVSANNGGTGGRYGDGGHRGNGGTASGFMSNGGNGTGGNRGGIGSTGGGDFNQQPHHEWCGMQSLTEITRR